MKKLTLGLAILLIISCSSAGELKQSLSEVKGQNIRVIRSYPTKKFTALSGNTVYEYSEHSGSSISCDIFFEVNKQDIIILPSYKGDACNSFYNNVLKPK